MFSSSLGFWPRGANQKSKTGDSCYLLLPFNICSLFWWSGEEAGTPGASGQHCQLNTSKPSNKNSPTRNLNPFVSRRRSVRGTSICGKVVRIPILWASQGGKIWLCIKCLERSILSLGWGRIRLIGVDTISGLASGNTQIQKQRWRNFFKSCSNCLTLSKIDLFNTIMIVDYIRLVYFGKRHFFPFSL